MTRGKKSGIVFKAEACLGVLVILGIGILFLVRAVEGARVKDFWDDELYGKSSVEAASYGQLWAGVSGQGSRAPLDYVFIKFLGSLYQPFFAHVPFNVYFRLNSIFWTFAAGMGVAFLAFFNFYRRKESLWIFLLQIILIAGSLLAFYFNKDYMHFAVEARPYALWNSLWFVILGTILVRGVSIWILPANIMLALSSLGALIQLLVLALCQLVFRFIDREGWIKALLQLLMVFLVPFLIALYYALILEKWSGVRNVQDFVMYTFEFFMFWMGKWPVLALSLAGTFLTAWNKQWRGCTVVFITMLLLYCLSPAINLNVLTHRFFYVPRQYLYYDLVYPLSCLLVAVVLPGYWAMIKNSWKRKSKSAS